MPYVNVNGVWKSGIQYINANGVWKQASTNYTNINGVWKAENASIILNEGNVKVFPLTFYNYNYSSEVLSNATYLGVHCGESGGQGYYRTTNSIDLTNFKTLYVRGKGALNDDDATGVGAHVGISPTAYNGAQFLDSSKLTIRKSLSYSTVQEVNIDISGLSGQYYIYLIGDYDSQSGTATFYSSKLL